MTLLHVNMAGTKVPGNASSLIKVGADNVTRTLKAKLDQSEIELMVDWNRAFDKHLHPNVPSQATG